ncbi:MAG: adenylate kinase [Clostridia bacterium]|nr:adenylate kinase [Clostridia bacterium]
MRLMLLGAPGVGKGSQAVLLAKALSVPHISTGDIFRCHIVNNTELGKEAQKYMDKGMLVPDELTVSIVASRLKQDDCQDGFILDGFPRTINQAVFLDKVLDELKMQLDMIINIVLDDRSIINRLSGRRICAKCGAVYHIEDKAPANEGICDLCKGELIQREDDNEETIVRRLKVYHEMTKPLIDNYKGRVKMVDVESNKSFEVTTQKVFSAVGLKSAKVEA